MRKLIVGLGVLVVVVVAAAFVGPLFVPTDSIKADVAAEVRKATGRELSVDGDLSFRLLPAPGVSADGVRLSNAEQSTGADMVSLDGATVEVALLPLLTGNIQVNRIVLRKPVILLEQYADGTNNWTFAPEAEPTPATGGTDTAAESAASGAPPVRFDNVQIVDGTLIYATPDQSERIEDIEMTLGAGSLTGPFRAEGSLVARGFDIDLNAAVGELVADKATPINARIATAGAKIDYSGVMSGSGDAARVAGQLEVRADDIAAMVASLSNGPAPASLQGKALELDGTVAATAKAVSVDDLALRLGEDSATGAIDVTLGEEVEANVVINMTQLDLDRLLAETGTAPAPSGGGAGSGDGGASGAGSPAADAGGFALPENVSASLESKIDTLVYRGGVVRQVLLDAELAQGVLNISRGSAQLPGGSTASLVGLVSPDAAGPKFDGQAEVSSDDFRSLLQWAGADVSAVPPERLRKMAGSVSVAATPQNITLTDIDVSVDVSRLRGGVAIALRERPGFGIGLSLDKLNVDAYLPQPDGDGTGGGAGSAASGGGQAQPNEPAASGGSPLAALDGFDAVLQLKAGDLTYQGQRIRGVNLDGTLQGGALELRDVSVANLEGAKVSAKGRIDGLAAAPKADLTVDIDAPNADSLLALAGVTPPGPVGPGKLNGTFKGDLENLAVDATLLAHGATLKTVGTVAALATPPRYDLTLDLKHPDASAFFARVGGNSGAPGVKTGPLAALVTARGDLNASDLAVNVGIGDGNIAADGRLENLAAGAPTGAMALNVNHPDMVAFVRTFANDYRPALAQAGPFELKSELALQPDVMTLSKLEGRAGPVSYNGSGRVALGGVRPDVTAELRTSEIIVDWFLPASSGSKGGAASSRSGGGGAAGGGSSSGGGQRWSREKLDLSALRTVDADVKITTPAITYTDIKVEEPQFAVSVKDGVLNLTRLSGNAFGGGFSMTAQVADREVPTMQYALKVEGADAAKFVGGASSGGDKGVASALELLFPVSDLNLVSGTLGADLKVASRGRSEFEMISNLGGDGAVQFTNAVVEGVDVCAISNRLDNIDGLESILALAAGPKGGQTKIATYNGRFDIVNGVATFPQQTINPDCATVIVSGQTDLPKWTINMRAQAGFPAHPEFPGLIVEQSGSLDAPNTRLVNLNELNQFIAGKAAGTALRKLAPDIQKVLPKELNNLLPGITGRRSQPQPAPATNEQQQQQAPAENQQTQPQQPADQFKNLLEGLIRR